MSKPFQDLIFCCTGIDHSQRLQLDEKISALGGQFYTDLMSLVQYLVVGNRNTEKYKFCVRYRHDISFLSISAIDDLYNLWKSGKDALFDKNLCALPVFSNFRVCVARIDRPSEEDVKKLMSERFRKPPALTMPKIIPKDPFLTECVVDIMSKLGATVSTTLSQSCTILIAANASGKRYDMAKQWKIPVVHPIWIYDSCLREAALVLEDYGLTLDFNPYNNTTFIWKKLFLSRLNENNPKINNHLPERLRPLVKNTEIWTSIMDSAHPLLTKEAQGDQWGENELSDHEDRNNEDGLELETPLPSDENSSSLFEDLLFLPLGLTVPEQAVLKSVVESHKGKILNSSEDPRITHVVMLVKNGPQTELMLLMLSSTIKRRINAKEVSIVTNWFIERSIYYGKICNDSWVRPMLGIVPSRKRCQVCITGFTGVELLHLEKLITYLNLEFCETLNSSRDILIVNINLFRASFMKSSPKLFEYKAKEALDCPIYTSGNGSNSVSILSSKNKMAAARKWDIPIVSLAFLWEMVTILQGQPNLTTPEISNLQWCIFAPKAGLSKSQFLTLNVPQTSSDTMLSTTESLHSADGSNDVKLPSPRKSKDREKYGRLVGRGESLLKKLEAAQVLEHDDHKEPPSDAPSSQDLSIIGYGNDEKAEKRKILLDKLEGNERPPKRPRRGVQNVNTVK